MAGPLLFDRVHETSITTGAGAFTLAGAIVGHRTFAAALSVGDTFPYCIAAQGGTEWEVGIGTLSAATTLTRTTVLGSSNGGSAVNFSAGTKDCFLCYTAHRAVIKTGALTSGRVPYISANGEITDSSSLLFNGTLFGVGSASLSVGYKLNIVDSGPTEAGVQPVAAFCFNTTGTPAAGLGAGIVILPETSTTENQLQASINASWVTVTHASRAADLTLSAYYISTAREGVRIRGASSGCQLGFFGATPVYRPASTDDLKDAFVNLGLYTDGGATPLNLDNGALSAGSGTFSAAVSATVSDAATNTTTNIITLDHKTSGTPAASFGAGIKLNLESTTTESCDGALLEAAWNVATHITRSADLILSAYNITTKREGLRIRGGGAGAQIGFFGITPVSQPSSTGETTGFTAGASTAVRNDSTFTGNVGSTAYTLSDIVKHLKNLGLIAQ